MSYSRPETTLKTFAVLRVMGDLLDPAEITNILKRSPTAAHGKDEKYYMGEKSGLVQGRTGVWMLSTDKIIKSDDFNDHLSAILAVLVLDHVESMLQEHTRPWLLRWFHPISLSGFLLVTGRLARLKALMETKGLRADLRCIWFGTSSAKPPVIPPWVEALFAAIPITIEKNFDTESAAALSA
jgi:hypothetical protein